MSIDYKTSSSSLNNIKTRVHPVMRKKSATLRDKNDVDRCVPEMGNTSTTTVLDAKVKPAKEKWKKYTEGASAKERGRRGEGPVKKKRKVGEEEAI